MSIVVKGPVLFHPENRTTLTGEATLILTLASAHGWPFEARVRFGEGADAAIKAAAYASRIRKGDHVTVEAAGARPRSDHGLAVNVLRGVARVDVRSDTECFVVPGLLR